MGYETYFVDADDTIFDFQKSSVVSFEKTMESLGLHSQWQHLFSSFKGVSGRLWADYEKGLIDRIKLRYERFTQTFEMHSIDVDVKQASHEYLENLCSNIYFIDGALEVLYSIKEIQFIFLVE